jgi:hypothetical protein
LIDHAAYQEATNYTATETARLDTDEAYRLSMILSTLFQ